MAHLDKFTRTDSRGVLKEAYRELRKYKNNVDTSLSMNNYSMESIKSSKEALKRVDARCAEVMNGRKMQKQTNVIVSCAYTLPEYFYDKPVDEQRKCFDAVYRFIQDRYGKENVIDGVVHNDETTPHMTVYTVPVTTSRKTGNITVSSASLCTQKEFNTFHKDLESYMEKEFGVKGLALNGRTKGNFTLEELKERTRVKEEQDKREKGLDAKLQEAEDAKKEQVLLKAKVEAEKEQVKQEKADLQTKEQQFNKEKADFDAEKKAEKEALEDEKLSLESQKKENEQVAEQNKRDAKKITQREKELDESLAEAKEMLEEVKDLKFYWNKIISQMQEIKIPIKGAMTRVGDFLSKKFNAKELNVRQERLESKLNELSDKAGNQRTDINAILASHGLSDDTSTEDTYAYGL